MTDRITQSEFQQMRSSASGRKLSDVAAAAMERTGEALKTQPAPSSARKTASPKPPTEHEEQVVLLQWVETSKTKWPELEMLFAIPNGAKLPYRKVTKKGVAISHERTKMLKEGMRPGVPDLMLAIARRDYHGMFIEMKRAKKSLSTVSPEQRAWIEALTRRGYYAVICYGADEAKAAIESYLGAQ